jgi:hypothetical protein
MSGRPSRKAADFDVSTAAKVLHGFTLAGRTRRKPRPTDFNNPMDVAALELLCRVQADPRTTSRVGAWAHRLQERGAGQAAPLRAGHCTPLYGPGEGLHLLVLDGQALAELRQAMADHADKVADYEQRRADLAHLRETRGG